MRRIFSHIPLIAMLVAVCLAAHTVTVGAAWGASAATASPAAEQGRHQQGGTGSAGEGAGGEGHGRRGRRSGAGAAGAGAAGESYGLLRSVLETHRQGRRRTHTHANNGDDRLVLVIQRPVDGRAPADLRGGRRTAGGHSVSDPSRRPQRGSRRRRPRRRALRAIKPHACASAAPRPRRPAVSASATAERLSPESELERRGGAPCSVFDSRASRLDGLTARRLDKRLDSV